MKAKYINPFTDYGFKKIFGEEASKPLLIDFLNALLPERNKIINLSFKNTEQLGQTEADRKAIYDIYCENENGEKFIVELQKAKQNYFKERTIYYSTFPIKEQAEKGEWNYNLKAVYCVGILDFTFDDYENEPEKSEVVHTIKLKNQNGKTFYDKLTYIYLEMPNFKKEENNLETRLDKWLYFIKNLEDFQTIPTIFKDEVFAQAFEKAELAKFDITELDNYESSLKIYRDLKGVIDTAFDEGKIEGKIETAINLIIENSTNEFISKITGLDIEQVEKLRIEIKKLPAENSATNHKK
jgi:predicted transposase/invertase (TIGR01784 family)